MPSSTVSLWVWQPGRGRAKDVVAAPFFLLKNDRIAVRHGWPRWFYSSLFAPLTVAHESLRSPAYQSPSPPRACFAGLESQRNGAAKVLNFLGVEHAFHGACQMTRCFLSLPNMTMEAAEVC
jgi:hypothetical protein